MTNDKQIEAAFEAWYGGKHDNDSFSQIANQLRSARLEAWKAAIEASHPSTSQHTRGVAGMIDFISADKEVEDLAYRFLRKAVTPQELYGIFDKHGEAINIALRRAADAQRKEQTK